MIWTFARGDGDATVGVPIDGPGVVAWCPGTSLGKLELLADWLADEFDRLIVEALALRKVYGLLLALFLPSTREDEDDMRCRLRSSRCLPFGFGAASSGLASVESMSTCEGVIDSRADRDSRAAMAGLRGNGSAKPYVREVEGDYVCFLSSCRNARNSVMQKRSRRSVLGRVDGRSSSLAKDAEDYNMV